MPTDLDCRCVQFGNTHGTGTSGATRHTLERYGAYLAIEKYSFATPHIDGKRRRGAHCAFVERRFDNMAHSRQSINRPIIIIELPA